MKKLITFSALLFLVTSCHTLETYHYEDSIMGGKMVRDNGTSQQGAFWVNTTQKNITRMNWFLMQKERVYLSSGYNYVINDSFYVDKGHKYHVVTTINDTDTSITYFLINERK